MDRRYLIALLVLILLSSIPTITFAGSWNGWIYQDPYPTSVNLFDVKFITPMKGWITGKYGTILYTEDGGEIWEAQESGTEEDLMKVSFVNDKMGWAAGRSGTIIHTEDGGKKWTTQYNIKALPTKVYFLNEKEGWVTGSSPIGVVYHTQNSGKTWQKMETGIQRAIGSVYFLNSQTGWIQAGEDVYRTADGGKKWEKSKLPLSELPTSPQPMKKSTGSGPTFGLHGISPNPMGEGLGPTWWQGDIAFANEKQGWAVVNQWYVFHTEDGGKTWAVQLDTGSMSYGFSHISLRDAQNGCVSGSTIYCTENGGRAWQERLGVGLGNSKELGGISLTSHSAGWVVGNDGRILKSEDNSKSWKSVSRWDKCGNHSVFINKKTRWLWYSWLPDICRTDDGGQTWIRQDVGIKIRDLVFIDDSFGWALGSHEEGTGPNKKIYQVVKRTTDGGKTWVTQLKELIDKTTFGIGLVSIYFVNRDSGWAVGENGVIRYTKDGGEQWEHQNSGTELYLYGIHFSDVKRGIITGDRRVAIGEDSEADKKAKGVILYTDDGGQHWRTAWWKIPVLLSGGPFFLDKNTSWVAVETLDGTLLLSSGDGGKTWKEKKQENISASSPYFIDKDRGVLLLEKNMLLITDNGGKTWRKMRKPHRKHFWHISEIFGRTVNDTK